MTPSTELFHQLLAWANHKGSHRIQTMIHLRNSGIWKVRELNLNYPVVPQQSMKGKKHLHGTTHLILRQAYWQGQDQMTSLCPDFSALTLKGGEGDQLKLKHTLKV